LTYTHSSDTMGIAYCEGDQSDMENLVGRTLGKYPILKHLGKGGMADVYLSRQPGLGRDVAIKVLNPYVTAEDSDFIARFQREGQAAAALRHPNIIQVFDFERQGDMYFLVMEYVEGTTLKELLRDLRARGETMSLSQVLKILRQIGGALDYAHEQGTLHRDIKPANIMINNKEQAILADFGIAKMMAGSSHTTTGIVSGTPTYMSPEQGQGEQVDSRSDLYSLGVVLYEMLTGEVPFKADTPVGVVMKHARDPLPAPSQFHPDLPPAVDQVLRRALAKAPDARYQTAKELADVFETAITGAPLPIAVASPVTQPAPLPAWPSLPEEIPEQPAADGGWLSWGGVLLAVVGFLTVLCLAAVAFALMFWPSNEKPIVFATFTPLPTLPPTATMVVPTATRTSTEAPSPTATLVVPTDTPSLPTDTPPPVPPTDTPPLPTDTPPPVPPTDTPPPPTDTPIPPTPTLAYHIKSFLADKTNIKPPECARLSWEVQDVLEVWLNGGEYDNEGVGGIDSRPACPTKTTKYTLRAVKKDGGTEESTLEITVTEPAATATPAGQITIEQTAAYTWLMEQRFPDCTFCSFSPNGQEIAAPAPDKLLVVATDASSYRQIPPSPIVPGYASVGECLWSHDGNYLAFVWSSETYPGQNVAVIRKDGSQWWIITLTNLPRWTVDGRLLVTSTADGQVYIAGAASGWSPQPPGDGTFELSAGKQGQHFYPWKAGKTWNSADPTPYHAE
jgi:serine/threonine protein kinase